MIDAGMSGDADRASPRFEPLRPAPRSRLIVAVLVGPLLWLVALLVATVVLQRTDAIEIALLVAGVSFLVSAALLLLLRAGRRREERRFAAGG